VKRLKAYIIAVIVYVISRALMATWRIRVFGPDARARAERIHPRGSFCLAVWHEHLFAAVLAHKGQRFAPLASHSSDGELVTFVMNRLGYRTVRGSSSRGGPEARVALMDAIAEGWFTAITVDGPRGPRRIVKGGVVDVARKTGAPVLPVVVLGDRQWVLTRSWDQFKIPKPFARVALHYGEPIRVAEDTAGLAFGDAKSLVAKGLADCEAAATADLAAWKGGAHGS
jgi:lysophospholipid acyltransferase (LPLAT)-like uncharacterized protein